MVAAYGAHGSSKGCGALGLGIRQIWASTVDKCIRVIKIYYNTNVKSQGHFKDGCPKVQRYGEEESVANSKPSPTTMRKKVEEEACGD
ncbi:hypothetical protein Gotri_006270 [Gossypium trilobum]|uniref:Uncharacterized protein n=1 Tax=Gossypium trilobum TaxID=34281 RepID=A0A7J9EZB4_9ROSI|nr:hypothetical protein [Gossypium trilobum]